MAVVFVVVAAVVVIMIMMMVIVMAAPVLEPALLGTIVARNPDLCDSSYATPTVPLLSA